MKKTICFIVTALILLGALYAVHDSQTAQGIGYYFFLKSGYGSRILYDIIADAVYMVLFVVLLIVPVKAGGFKETGAFLRFTLLYSALMPIQSPNYLFDLLFERDSLETFSLYTRFSDTVSVVKFSALLLILAVGYLTAIKGKGLKTKEYVLIALAIVSIVCALLLGTLTPLFLFLAQYFIIWLIFGCLETGEFESVWFYGFMAVVTVYNILYTTAAAAL